MAKKKGKDKPKVNGPARRYKRQGRSAFMHFNVAGTALVLELRKPRASAYADLCNAIPAYTASQQAIYAWIKACAELKEGEAQPDAPDMTIPGHEIASIASFMALNTLAMSGDDSGAAWEDLDEDEKIDVWETLPSYGLMRAYGELIGRMLAHENPKLLDKLKAQ